MVRDPFGGESAPDLRVVLDALDDEDCRTIVSHLEHPMTASEISETTGIPLSTTYRKLDLLADASLVDTRTEIREDGHHTTRYVLDFAAVRIGLADGRELEVAVERPARTADERLARLWSEVRKET